MIAFLQALWALSLDAAPWLVIGFIVGGVFKSLLPVPLLQRHLRGDGFLPVVKAAALGMPLPLCSCGVIPAALGLREAGASKSATISFLVSTPETGVDSISISYALLGPIFAIIRPIAALYSAIITGGLVSLFANDERQVKNTSLPDNASAAVSGDTKLDSCAPEGTVAPSAPSCCDSKVGKSVSEQPASVTSAWAKLAVIWSGIYYTFTQLYRDILLWLVIGLVFAAAIQAWLPGTFLATWGQSAYALLVMAVVGIPMYICATASTPIAAGLLVAGVSPGAVMVFLMAGPATNMATIGVIQQQMGKRVMMLYLLGVIFSAITTGWVVNQWFSHAAAVEHIHMSHDSLSFPVRLGCLLLLVGIAVWQGWQQWRSSIIRSNAAASNENGEMVSADQPNCCSKSTT